MSTQSEMLDAQARIRTAEAHIIAARANALATAIRAGCAITEQEFREHLGLPREPPKGPNLHFNDQDILQYHIENGVITINEARKSLNLPPVPWGNVTAPERTQPTPHTPHPHAAPNPHAQATPAATTQTHTKNTPENQQPPTSAGTPHAPHHHGTAPATRQDNPTPETDAEKQRPEAR